MNLIAAYRACLLGDTYIAANCPTIAPIRPSQNPPDTFCVLRDLGGPSATTTMAGVGDLYHNRMEITFWAKKLADAASLAAKARALLAPFNGVMGGGGGVSVQVYSIIGPRSTQDPTSGIMQYQLDILALVNQSTVT